MIRKQNKTILKPDAFPTIFVCINESIAAQSAANDTTDSLSQKSHTFEDDLDHASSKCLSCSELRAELIDLKRGIFKTDMDHSVYVQSLLRQIDELKKQNTTNSANMKNMREQLSKDKQKIIDIQQQNIKDIDERLFSIDRKPIHHVRYIDEICYL